MKTIKVSEATNLQLNWLVAKIEGFSPQIRLSDTGISVWIDDYNMSLYTERWAQGGPIIERELISLAQQQQHDWVASLSHAKEVAYTDGVARRFCTMRGVTPLVAAMRCYVASKLGNEVDIPKELE